MPSERSQASREDVAQAIQEIRAYHDRGRQSLRELPERGKHGARAIDAQAEQIGWNPTKLRKARQFAHPEDGYSREMLTELCKMLREHRPVFGIAHVGLLVTVPWPKRGEIQRECIEGNWSTAELQAEIKRQFGSRRQGGRRRQVPGDPGHILLQIDEMADTWLRWSSVVTEGDEDDRPILDTLPDRIKERVKAVSRAMNRLREDVLAELEAGRDRKEPGD